MMARDTLGGYPDGVAGQLALELRQRLATALAAPVLVITMLRAALPTARSPL